MSDVLNLYNTRTRKVEPFLPLHDHTVGLYSCGPTVYAPQHLGNLRAYIFVDVLKRALQLNGNKVKHVMNITDVGHLSGDGDTGKDKVEEAQKNTLFYTCKNCGETASSWLSVPPDSLKTLVYENNHVQCSNCGAMNTLNKEDLSYNIGSVVDEVTTQFIRDLKTLNVELPDKMPKATSTIDWQIDLIHKLETKGFTYKTSDGIYFDTSKFRSYGKLGGQPYKGKRAGIRVQLGEKRNSTDFALWKFSPANSMRKLEWNSPWGTGYPGWHIECSAMSMKLLGSQFDIHTGGIEHIAVHHENEIAQSEAATGKKPFVTYWLHHGHMLFNGEKMSKSIGNVITLNDVINRGINPIAFRFLCLQTNYRKKMEFSWDSLERANIGLMNIRSAIATWPFEFTGSTETSSDKSTKDKFRSMVFRDINDDLNIPKSLAIINFVFSSSLPIDQKIELLSEFDRVWGLGLREWAETNRVKLNIEQVQLLAEREKVREQKDWEKSDQLRQKLEQQGIIIEDTPTGPKLRKK